jgi:hypothetical protein
MGPMPQEGRSQCGVTAALWREVGIAKPCLHGACHAPARVQGPVLQVELFLCQGMEIVIFRRNFTAMAKHDRRMLSLLASCS